MSNVTYAERKLSELSKLSKLSVKDGTVLHVEHHPAVGPARATLVMLHGFAVHCGRHRQVAEALSRFGLAVTAFDCRGHGLSTGRRGYVRRFADFLDDLHEVIESASRDDPRRPLVVLGHSHGATVALRYALTTRSTLHALVLAAPWLELKLAVPRWKLALAQMVGGVWPTLAMGNELRSSDTTRDPTARERWADDPLAHQVATPRWFNEVRAAQAYILGHPDTLRVPTLIAVPGDDRIVSSERTLAFARAARAMVDVKVYPEAYHELFLEPDWRTIVEDFASWVVARLPAPYTSVSA
ncbi:MAG: lysophospholipase [Polyangia bacterium]